MAADSTDNPSFVLLAPHRLTFESRPAPSPASLDPHSVHLLIQRTGICGSDVHYWQHGRIGRFVLTSPMVLGHESAGVISAVGSLVTHLRPGDRVAVEPGIPCRRCARCRAGTYNLCAGMAFAATPPHDGTLARYFAAPADFCYKLPDHVSVEEGALVEPLAVAVHVVKQAEVAPGDRVVVFGAGPVGLLCLAVARYAFGARAAVSVDVNEKRVAFAEEFAATGRFVPREGEGAEEGARRLIKECGLPEGDGEGADVAIDATGAEPCIQMGVHVLRTGGTFVQAGMGKPEVVWPAIAMVAKELTVKGSFRYGPGDYELAVELVGSGKVDVKRLITDVVPFEEAERAFEDTKAAKGIKIIIKGPGC